MLFIPSILLVDAISVADTDWLTPDDVDEARDVLEVSTRED